MSASMIPMMPSQRPSSTPRTRTRPCPFASSCNCVFNGQSAHEEGLSPEVAELVTRGWNIVSADTTEVVLERRSGLPFCWNASLVVLTGFLWLIYWVPRMRHPRVQRKTVLLQAADQLR